MTWEQVVGVTMLALAAVIGIFLMIDDRGGWTLFWAELKRKGKKQAALRR